MPVPVGRDVLLFSGQGASWQLPDPGQLDRWTGQLGPEERASWEKLLKQCLEAFQCEYLALSATERSIFSDEDDFQIPSSSEHLFNPSHSLQTHPVYETIGLYLRQILDLLLYHSKRGDQAIVVETAGLCTGILPAILAASFVSYMSEEFLSGAVQTFRLAFWIGVRVSLYCCQSFGDGWRDKPSVLGVFGLCKEEVEVRIASWNHTDGHSRVSFLSTSL